ncbi:MAG TPA: hypothetical protein DCQ12_00625 [Candidatus Cloacimonas sp.]|nr:hypothetical protein [Candidatus Cloacimonas sp.]
MRIWFDITNTPQVHFILAIKGALEKRTFFKSVITTREFSETTKLLREKTDTPFQIIGTHRGKKTLNKISGLFGRFFEIHREVSGYDISISCGSDAAIWSSFLKRKKSIAFGDNDLAKQWTYGVMVNHTFFPDAIDESILVKQGISARRLTRYHGFKEDIYIADYVPEADFPASVPFDNYVVVRPENLQANYINNDSAKPITPLLLKKLSDSGYNIFYLPRYNIDRNYAKDVPNVYVPEQPINGLDACYYADAVLTGAGTFAREAACLGVPSFSFFAGKRLLAVDRAMIKEGKMFFSRDVDELMVELKKSSRHEVDLSRSKAVQKEVIDKLKSVIEGF